MAARSSSTVFVSNLPADVKESEIENLFSEYGRIKGIDLRTLFSPCHCFVEFEESSAANDAIKTQNGCTLEGRRIKVELSRADIPSRPKRGGGDTRDDRRSVPCHRSEFRVIVRGLPVSASWRLLKDHMRKAGDVSIADVYRDDDEAKGVVRYKNHADMIRAVTTLDGSEFVNPGEGSYIITVKYDKGSRRRDRRRSRNRSRSPRGHRRRSRSHSKSPRGYRKRIRSRSRSPRGDRRLSRRRSRSPKGDRRLSRRRSRSPRGNRRPSRRRRKNPRGNRRYKDNER